MPTTAYKVFEYNKFLVNILDSPFHFHDVHIGDERAVFVAVSIKTIPHFTPHEISFFAPNKLLYTTLQKTMHHVEAKKLSYLQLVYILIVNIVISHTYT